MSNDTIVGLDIGTTKICAVVGRINEEESLEIIGVGSSPAKGVRKGIITNIDQAVWSIRQAVEAAESMSGSKIESVIAGISGNHIQAINSHGVVAVRSKEIGKVDIARVMENARAISLSPDRDIIHAISQEYIVDEQSGIKDPIGMSGVRLEVKAHIITGSIALVQNVIKSCNRAGLDVSDIILEPLASAKAILSSDETELGVAMIDIGGGTTDLAVFYDDSIRYTKVLGVGGNQFTHDIAVGIRTPEKQAEKIKIKYASIDDWTSSEETIEVPGISGRQSREISKGDLYGIVQPRAEELFYLIKNELDSNGFESMLTGGIVLTGGGSMLGGMVKFAEEFFNMPARIGVPYDITGIRDMVEGPQYATVVGLIKYGIENSNTIGRKKPFGQNSIFERMKRWFKEMF